MDEWNQYQQDNWQGQPQPPKRGDGEGIGFGVASLVLGIISLFLCCTCINWLTGVLAIIFGIIQIIQSKKRGMAIAGIVTAVVSLLLTIFIYGSFFFGDWQADDSFDDYFNYFDYSDLYDDWDYGDDFQEDFEDYMEDAGEKFL